MSYDECLEFLYRQLPMYQRDGSVAFKKDLSNTRALCKALGDPQSRLKMVHVAGTNGKGSVSHLIAAALQAEGYRVGLYTSPHYVDFRERIKINGVYMAPDAVVDFVNRIRPTLEEIRPSFFELTVAMAFDYFAEKEVDFAIIETGLGGRLDSTNVIQPLISVITNISLDHQSMLGDTLAEIALEKAGIIKKDTPVVVGERHAETDRVFEDRSALLHAKIVFAEDEIRFSQIIEDHDGYRLKAALQNGKVLEQLKLGLFGAFQLRNLKTAIVALEVLCTEHDICIRKEHLLYALENVVPTTRLQGRWEVLSSEPYTVADSGHNAGGLELTIAQLLTIPYKELRIVFGVSRDKTIAEMLSLLPASATYYWCAADLARAMPASELRKEGEALGLLGNAYPSVREALEAARAASEKEDVLFIGGSAFVVGEVLSH